MSKPIAGRLASNSALDSFKARANRTRESLVAVFERAVDSGEKRVFSQARVYEYQARQEGFTSYAAVKATGGAQEPPPHLAMGAFLRMMFPSYFQFIKSISSQKSLEKEIEQWITLDKITTDGNLIAIYSCGVEAGFCVLATDDSASNINSDKTTYFIGCNYPQFEAAIQLCPVPEEWANKPFQDYVSANIRSWERKLMADVESKMSRVLIDALKVIGDYKNTLSESIEVVLSDSSGVGDFMGELHFILRPYIIEDGSFHILGCIGKYLIVAYNPVIFNECQNEITDYLLSFGIMDIHSFAGAFTEELPEEFSCRDAWFKFWYEPDGESHKETISRVHDDDFAHGKVPIHIPERLRAGGWYVNVDMIYDKKALDYVENFLRESASE